MNKQKKEVKDKKISFRVPNRLFEIYEQRCIEEQVSMSQTFQTAFLNYLTQKNKDKVSTFTSLPER